MSSLVSYGQLRPAFVGSLAVIFRRLLDLGDRAGAPVQRAALSDAIAYSDSGVWGDESVDPERDVRVFRVSDFDGDFRLNYASAPPRSLSQKQRDKFVLSPGDLLVVKSSGSAKQVVSGRVAVFNGNGESAYAASNFLMRLRPRPDVDARYLAYALGSPPTREWVADSVKTMTYPNISFKLYRNVAIPLIPLQDQRSVAMFLNGLYERRDPLPPLPKYLAEQRRIVAKIDQLAAKIDEARGLRERTLDEVRALIQSARRTAIGDSPGSDWLALTDVVENIENGWSPQCLKRPAANGEWGVVKVGAVSFGAFDPAENKALPASLAPRPQHEIRQGDLLMSRANTLDLVGACAYVHETPARLLLCDKIFRFVFRRGGRLAPKYLDQVLKSPALRAQIVAGATGTSPTMKNIAKAKIMRLRLPVPPVPEQRRIVAYLDELQAKVDRLKALQAQTAAELDALLPSILDKAFKGEL